ncbi:MAG: PHB depolymerase family esterase [Bacteroidota bacterium]
MKTVKYALVAMLMAIICLSGCQSSPGPGKQVWVSDGFEKSIVEGYWLYLPQGYTEGKQYPVILFLAGAAGASTHRYEDAKVEGPAKFAMNPEWVDDAGLRSVLQDSVIIVNPHMRFGAIEKRAWAQYPKSLSAIVDSVVSAYQGDASRVYVTGLSKGGQGCWDLVKKLPQTFAAVAPVAGRITCTAKSLPTLSGIPMWLVHNEGDQAVPYAEYTKKAVERMEEEGYPFFHLNTVEPNAAQVLPEKRIVSVLPQKGHTGWDETYSSPAFYSWLLAQQN